MKASSLRRVIPGLIAERRPGFIWGPPGVGKSDVMAQICHDMKIELRDVRMNLLDPTDLKGFPVPDLTKKQMKWLPADFLPTKGKGIIFLDDMPLAPMATQSVGYQLILTFKVGEYELPPGWGVMAAGNRASDRGVFYQQSPGLASRFVHLNFEVDVHEWNMWAMESGIHEHVRAFIRFKPSLLHKFDPAANLQTFPCPRTWSFVNDIYQKHLNQEDEFEMINGCVGEGAGSEFSSFVRLIKDLPKVEQVLIDPERTKLPENPSAMMAIITALDPVTTPNNIARVMTYVQRFSVEMQAVFIRVVCRRNSKLTETKTYADWGLKNQDVLT